MGARASPRAWVRMVRGVNACSRHSRSARHVKGGWHKRAEPEPAELSLSRRRPVQPSARSLPFAGRQGSRVHVSCRGLLFKSARRAPSRMRPVRGRQAEARTTSRARAGARKSLVLRHRGTGRLELGGGFSRFAEFSFSRLRFSDRPPVLPRGSARIGSGIATGARPGAALRNYSCV